MNERQGQQAEKLYLTNLNIDWLINKYPLPPDATKRHFDVDNLLKALNISGETRAVVRAAAVLGDLANISDPRASLARPEVIPNTVSTITSALDLAKETGVDIRLEINLALRYLDIVNRSHEGRFDDTLSLNYLDSTLNPAIMYLGRVRQILPNSPL